MPPRTQRLPAPFGKYQLLERLGSGGTAEVFRARLPGPAGFEKTVVIKRLHPHLVQSRTAVEMLVNEAKLIERLRHRNVVEVYELGQLDDGELYLALEYVDGIDLKHLLAAAAAGGQVLPVWFGVHVATEVLDALTYAHELTDYTGAPLGVVHRDITPGNIFLSFQGEVKVGDFGIAKTATSKTQTLAGQIKGTIPYMSPEQLMGHRADARSDLFAVGVVLWECLTQRRLFGGRGSDAESARAILSETREPPSAFNPEVPATLDEAVLAALERDATKRVQTARELQAWLHDVLDNIRPRVARSEVRDRVEMIAGRARNPDAMPLRGSGYANTVGATPDALESAYGDLDLNVLDPVVYDPPADTPELIAPAPVPALAPTTPRLAPRHPFEPSELLEDPAAISIPNAPKFGVPFEDAAEIPTERERSRGSGRRAPDEDLPPFDASDQDRTERTDAGVMPEASEARTVGERKAPPADPSPTLRISTISARPAPVFELRSGAMAPIGTSDHLGLASSASNEDEASLDGRVWIRARDLDQLLTHASGGDWIDQAGDPPQGDRLDLPSTIALFTRISVERTSGRLLLEGDERRRVAFDLRAGRPIASYTNIRTLGVLEIALDRRAMQVGTLAFAVEQVIQDRRPIHGVLRSLVPESFVALEIEMLHARIEEALRWAGARFALDPGPELAGAAPLAGSMLAPVARALRRSRSNLGLLMLLGDRLSTPLVPATPLEPMLRDLGFDAADVEAAVRLVSGRTLGETLRSASHDDPADPALALVLLESGLARAG